MTGTGDTPPGGIPEQGRPAFDPWWELPRADDVPDDHPVREMLAAVADDPAAPPSTVTVAAILAAARAQSGADGGQDGSPRATDIDPATGRARYVPPVYARSTADPDTDSTPPASDGVPTPVWSGTVTPAPVVPASVLEARRARQRRRLTAILAAAGVIGVAVVAVPFAVSRDDGSTAASAPAAATMAAGGAAGAASSSERAAPAEGQALSGAGSATSTLGQPEAASADQSDDGFGAPTQPSAAESAAGAAGGTTQVPSPGNSPDGAAPTGGCAALPPAVATALAGALPGGLYGDPEPLTSGCGPDTVYGATLPNTQGQSPLTVTVNRVAAGGCTTASGPDQGCVSIGAGQYVSTTADGGIVVYAYAGGLEVAIAQGLGAVDGTSDPAAGSATLDELLQAAQSAADAAAAGG